MVCEGLFPALPRMLSIRCGVKYLLSWTWGSRIGSVKCGPSARNQVGLDPGPGMKGSMLPSQGTQVDYQQSAKVSGQVEQEQQSSCSIQRWLRVAAGDDKAQFPLGKWILGTLFDNYTNPLWSFRSLVTIISCITLFTAP